MTPRRAAAFAALAAVAILGCAPFAPYRETPIAAVMTAAAGDVAPEDAPTPPRAMIEPGSADRERHHAGSLVRSSGSGPFVALVCGDTRPGFRMESNSPAYGPVEHIFEGSAGGFLRGLLWTPVFLVTAIVPTLDGPRDLVTVFTRRPRGGAEIPVRRAMEAELPADLVVHAGDIVFDGRRGRLWEDFEEIYAPLLERVLLFAAPGNHERSYDPVAAASYGAMMGEPATPGRYWYSLDVPAADTRFVFLDSNVMTDVHANVADAEEQALCDAQFEWMEAALDGKRRFQFVVLHHPLISTGHYEGDWGAEESATAARRRARVLEICARHGVSAVIAGHEHLYFRSRLDGAAGGSLWHLVSGGGGSPLYPIDRGKLDRQLARTLPAGWTLDRGSVKVERTYHFARLELPEAGSAGPARWIACRVRGGTTTPFDTVAIGGAR